VEEIEIRQRISAGQEAPGTEFKSACSRTDKDQFAKITKAVVAMPNRRYGGVINIGADDNSGRVMLNGLNSSQLGTWQPERFQGGLAAYIY
jgi:hypothetical protein|tara:strand:+ start:180 stop:452 length:273 start_codon:yes stop_codon:yes gene_type:complete